MRDVEFTVNYGDWRCVILVKFSPAARVFVRKVRNALTLVEEDPADYLEEVVEFVQLLGKELLVFSANSNDFEGALDDILGEDQALDGSNDVSITYCDTFVPQVEDFAFTLKGKV